MKIFNYKAIYKFGELISFEKKSSVTHELEFMVNNCISVEKSLAGINNVFVLHIGDKKYLYEINYFYDDEEKILNHFNKLNERNNSYGKIL